MKNTLETRLGLFVALVVLAAFLIINTVGGLDKFRKGLHIRALFDTAQELSALNVPFGSQIPARATADDATDPLNPIHGMSMTGNISAETPIAGTQGATITAYDSLGNAKTIRIARAFSEDGALDTPQSGHGRTVDFSNTLAEMLGSHIRTCKQDTLK